MDSPYLKERNIDPLYYGPPNWGKSYFETDYKRPLYGGPDYRSPYSDPFSKVKFSRDPLSRDPFKTTPSSLTTDTYQHARQPFLQQDRIPHQRLQQEHNRTRRSGSECDLPSQHLAQSHQNSLQRVETNGSRGVDPSQLQLLVNDKNFETGEVGARMVDDFAIVHAKCVKCPDKDGIICQCKMPDEVDSGKLTFSSRQDGVFTSKFLKKVQMRRSVKIAYQCSKFEKPDLGSRGMPDAECAKRNLLTKS